MQRCIVERALDQIEKDLGLSLGLLFGSYANLGKSLRIKFSESVFQI